MKLKNEALTTLRAGTGQVWHAATKQSIQTLCGNTGHHHAHGRSETVTCGRCIKALQSDGPGKFTGLNN